jgi:hypothetical protein
MKHRVQPQGIIAVALYSISIALMPLSGCSPSHPPDLVGKFSRTLSFPTTKKQPAYGYTNTTEHKADGTYGLRTTRGGHKVSETGTYKVSGDTITYHAKSGRSTGQVFTKKYRQTAKGLVIDPGRFERAKE